MLVVSATTITRTNSPRMHQVDPWREDVVRTLMELRASSGDRSGALSLRWFAKRLHRTSASNRCRDRRPRDPLQAASPPALDGGRGLRRKCRSRDGEGEFEALLAAFHDVGRCEHARIRLRRGRHRQEPAPARTLDATHRTRVARRRRRNVFRRGAPRISTLSGGARCVRRAPAFAGRRPTTDHRRSAEFGDARWRCATPRLVFDAIASAIGTLSEDRPLPADLRGRPRLRRSDARRSVVRRAPTAGRTVYFVTTYRSDEVGPAHPLMRRQRDLLAAGGATVLALERLGRDDVQHAVAGLVAERPSAAALAEEFFRISEGVPLVLQQVIQNWAESGERSPSQAAPVLGDLVASRTARLSDDARTLLEVAAIAGDAFDLEVVSAVAGLDAGAAFRCVDELLERRLLRENSSRFGSRLSFTHALIRTSIYDALPTVVRDRRHRRLGTIFAQMGADVVADAAFHLDAAATTNARRAHSSSQRINFARMPPTSARRRMPNAASRLLAIRPSASIFCSNVSRSPTPRATGRVSGFARAGGRHRRQRRRAARRGIARQRARFRARSAIGAPGTRH